MPWRRDRDRGGRHHTRSERAHGGVLNPDGDDIGIELAGGEDNLIARNQIRHTLHEGMRIEAFEPDRPTVDSVIRDNRVSDAGGDGFSVAVLGERTVDGTLLQGNTASGAGDDGIDVASPDTTLTKNTANRNHHLGIEAVPASPTAAATRPAATAIRFSARTSFVSSGRGT